MQQERPERKFLSLQMQPIARALHCLGRAVPMQPFCEAGQYFRMLGKRKL